jgi:hypothetical protein
MRKIFILNRYEEEPNEELEESLRSRGFELFIYCKGSSPREFEITLEDYGYEVTAYLDWLLKNNLSRLSKDDIVCFSQYNIWDEYRGLKNIKELLAVFDWLVSQAREIGCAVPHTWYDPTDYKVPDYISKYERRSLLSCGSQMYIRGDIISQTEVSRLEDISRWMEESKNCKKDNFGKWKTCEMERRFLSVFNISRFAAYFSKHSPISYSRSSSFFILKNWIIENDKFVPFSRKEDPPIFVFPKISIEVI